MAADARAAVYQVAQDGDDAGPPDGTSAHPFPTISVCAQMAQAGDTCLVHAGTYRETVSPAASGTPAAPIQFLVADGECVTVSGTEPLEASFSNGGGSEWVAPVPGPILQMFSNQTMIWEAQWPNRTPGALFDVPKGTAGQGTGVFPLPDGGSVSRLVDPNIPAGDWTGATVFILPGYRWQSDSRPVAAYDPATHTLTFDTTIAWAQTATQPLPTNPYYLFGSTLALDTQDEWVVTANTPAAADASASPGYTLTYYSSDNPANHALEYKARLYAFDVAQSYIQIVGFHVFGAAVRLAGNGNVVDSLSIEYPTHLRSFDAYYTEGDVNRIVGNGNVWKNSIIEKSGSAGLIVAGDGNVVENDIANDIAYEATNHAGFDMDNAGVTYSGNVFAYDTVSRSGRSGIYQYGAQAGRVVLNMVSSWALLTYDMGGIYAWGTDGNGNRLQRRGRKHGVLVQWNLSRRRHQAFHRSPQLRSRLHVLRILHQGRQRILQQHRGQRRHAVPRRRERADRPVAEHGSREGRRRSLGRHVPGARRDPTDNRHRLRLFRGPGASDGRMATCRRPVFFDGAASLVRSGAVRPHVGPNARAYSLDQRRFRARRRQPRARGSEATRRGRLRGCGRGQRPRRLCLGRRQWRRGRRDRQYRFAELRDKRAAGAELLRSHDRDAGHGKRLVGHIHRERAGR